MTFVNMWEYEVILHRVFRTLISRDAWVAQSVKCLTLVQVMISLVVSLSPALEPGAYFTFCVSLSLCPSPTCTLFLFLKNKQTLKKTFKKRTLISSVNKQGKIGAGLHGKVYLAPHVKNYNLLLVLKIIPSVFWSLSFFLCNLQMGKVSF